MGVLKGLWEWRMVSSRWRARVFLTLCQKLSTAATQPDSSSSANVWAPFLFPDAAAGRKGSTLLYATTRDPMGYADERFPSSRLTARSP